MDSFNVASSRNLESLRSLFGREIQTWRRRGVVLSVTESTAGDLLVFRCDIPKSDEYPVRQIMNRIKRSVANGICDIIIDEYEKTLVERLLQDQYAYLSVNDRDTVKRKVMRKLMGCGGKELPGIIQRKSRIWARLIEYLEKEDQLVLEGFITFRLKEYLEELFDVVDATVEDHLIEREYKEFLRLLRHFMERQKSHVPEISIIRKGKDEYKVLDIEGKPFEGEIGAFLSKGVGSLDLGVDDLIVSVVVTLAPERLIWHGSEKESPCYDLLKDLLEERMTVCPGCALESSPEKESGPRVEN